MSESKAARRYAQALIELCDEAKNHAVVEGQLAAFSKAVASSAELRAALESPVLPLEAKRDIVTKIGARLLFAPVTRNFLLVLLDHGRLDELSGIQRELATRMDAAGGRIRATVTSAVPLEKVELERIQKALGRLTGKTVAIDARVDPAVLGGVVTQVGSIVLDGSLRTDLAKLREALAG